MARLTYFGSISILVFFIVISAAQMGRAGDLSFLPEKPLVVGLAAPVTVYPDPSSYSLLFSKSAATELRYSADQSLYAQPKPGDAENEIIGTWREYVYAKLLTVYSAPREDGADYCIGPDCPRAYNDPVSDRKPITRLVSRETLRFMRQKVPQIEEILISLRLEVADRASKDDPSPVFKDMGQITELKADKNDNNKGLSVQTRMRVRLDDGDISLVTETRATYRKASSYFRVNLRKPGDTALGFKYSLGQNTHLQLERETKSYPSGISAFDGSSYGRTSQNALRLVFLF